MFPEFYLPDGEFFTTDGPDKGPKPPPDSGPKGGDSGGLPKDTGRDRG